MYSAVITAAGTGSRAGLGYNKMLFEYQGQTVLETIVKTFVNSQYFDQLIITVNASDIEAYTSILKPYNVELVIGGAERMDSVANGVSKAHNQFVFVHDGARIFLDNELIERLVGYEGDFDGLALATNVIDTTLIVTNGRIEQVLDRDKLFNMQTPQVVNRDIYLEAYAQAKREQLNFTDEMSMLSYYHHDCYIVESESYNKKLTRPEDFEVEK